jgi:hypothetical protein
MLSKNHLANTSKMLSKIYISVPITNDWDTVTSFKRRLVDEGFEVSVWDRKSRYDQREFDKAEAVLFLLPNNKFKATQRELPSGLINELSRAYASNKKIYVGYVTSSGEYNIYNSETDGRYIHALSGSANNLFDLNRQYRAAEKIFINSRYGIAGNPCAEIELPKGPTGYSGRPGVQGVNGIEFDERLLLMM